MFRREINTETGEAELILQQAYLINGEVVVLDSSAIPPDNGVAISDEEALALVAAKDAARPRVPA